MICTLAGAVAVGASMGWHHCRAAKKIAPMPRVVPASEWQHLPAAVPLEHWSHAGAESVGISDKDIRNFSYGVGSEGIVIPRGYDGCH